MRRQSFIALAAVTALFVVGAVVAVDMREERTAAVAGGDRLFPELLEEANAVDRLTIRSAEGGTITLENAEERWVVAEKSGYPADFEKVRATLLSVSQMETVEPRTAKPELLPKLELSDVDAPESKSIRVTAQVGEEILADAIIGRWQDEGRDKGLFARRADESQSWLVKGATGRPDKQIVNWLDRDIVNVDQRRVKSVTITHADGDRVAIEKKGPEATDYALVSKVPEGREAKPAHEMQALASITDFLILEDVRPAETIDFAKPAVVAETVTYDGLTLRFEGVESDGHLWVRLLPTTGAADPALAAFVEANKGKDSAEGRTADQFKTAEQVAEQAQAIEARTGDWAYRLTDYKTDKIRTTTDEITQPIAAAEAKPKG